MNYDLKTYLQKDILDFWLRNGIDREYGGIFTCLDEKGEIYGTDKSVWFQGRALWVFSKAYNTIEKKAEYLEASKQIYSFLPKCTDCDGRMFFTVTQDGRPLQKRRYYYSETFAAIGCAELYKATGDARVMEKAEFYFDTAYKLFTTPVLSKPKINPENAPFKSLAPVMIMLNTAMVLSSTNVNRQKYEDIARECASEIIGGGYINADVGATLESVTLDKKFYDSPSTRVTNPGHSLECGWFLLGCGTMFKDKSMLEAGKKVIDMAFNIGIDKVNGGVIAFKDVLGKPPVQLEWDMKLWWPQCEGIIAALMAYKLFGDKKYFDMYETLRKYTQKYFADKENGEWYGYLHYDNTPSTTLKGNIFKGPFHLPRMLMLLYITERDGCADKFFS